MLETIFKIVCFALGCVCAYNLGHYNGFAKGVDTCSRMLGEYMNTTIGAFKKKQEEEKDD